jgi:hypothetical protein
MRDRRLGAALSSTTWEQEGTICAPHSPPVSAPWGQAALNCRHGLTCSDCLPGRIVTAANYGDMERGYYGPAVAFRSQTSTSAGRPRRASPRVCLATEPDTLSWGWEGCASTGRFHTAAVVEAPFRCICRAPLPPDPTVSFQLPPIPPTALTVPVKFMGADPPPPEHWTTSLTVVPRTDPVSGSQAPSPVLT